ncbi:MAG: UTRA domain-containing protein [Tabrizicola sp.]|nr:UTRA domain-containing protein [Tabrizicola sp.]
MASEPRAASAPKDRTTFREVMAEIRHRITEGSWGPGTLLPAEVALAREFGCTRTTINRALREISDLGILDRRRKAGTRVRLAPRREARFEMPIVRAEIEKAGATYSYTRLSHDILTAPDWLCERLRLPDDAQVVHLICLHRANGAPFQLEDRWINLAALPEAGAEAFVLVGPNEWLVATVPYSEVEISFQAEAADALAAAHLGHPSGAPVFVAERTTWWKGAPITHVRLCYRPGHRMTTHY